MGASSRPQGDLDDRVRQQVRILLDAAKRYDQGAPHARDEALTMAIRLRTLLHKGNDQSGLERGGYLTRMRFCSSVGIPPNDSSPFIGALQQVLILRPEPGQQHVSFKPAFGHHIRQLSPGHQARLILTAPTFQEWWTSVLIRDFDRREFTREFIVKTVANKDGGAHLDPKLPQDYLAISRGAGTFGLSMRIDDGDDHHAGDPVPALLRQITWEFEQTLIRTAPSLLTA
jgi:hypothetical protein